MDTEIILKPKSISKRRQLYINVRNKYRRLIARMRRDVFMKEQLEQKAFKNGFNISKLRFEWEQKEQQKINKIKFNKSNL
jgi:hypothetical protein